MYTQNRQGKLSGEVVLSREELRRALSAILGQDLRPVACNLGSGSFSVLGDRFRKIASIFHASQMVHSMAASAGM